MHLNHMVKYTSYILLGLSLLLVSPISAAVHGEDPANQAQVYPGGQWSYSGQTGPDNWAALSDSYATCGAGHRQSPVDISNTKKSYLPPLNFKYRTSVLSINRDGGNIWVDYDSGSYLKIRGKRYRFVGFDFHTPSEHSFNGKRAEMEIHLHHIEPQGQRLIVAIPVVGGHRTNITLTRIWDNIPNRNSLRQYRRIGINPIFLLPVDRSYALYSGSETKPPCKEDVLWIVFTNPIRVSDKEIARFHRIVGNNARPIQPLNGRVVVQSDR
jgi:carbonic anhydrase